MTFRHGGSSPNRGNNRSLELCSRHKSKDCALLDTCSVDHLLPRGRFRLAISPPLSGAAIAEANNLRLRANVTIPEGLHSVTISLGVASDATVR